ncbi:MAG: hypothetical protein OEM23_03625 [Gemmatimonadota bacterium]|nr:hypothetical protein [Gemmatimonadota bacterium]MDH3427503.1 hypothetical protein [Gemmatimonadota bacterium]
MNTHRNWHTQGLLRARADQQTDVAERDRAVRRIAMFLHTSVKSVEANLANSLLTVLCRIPENVPLRRSQDRTILGDVQLLFEEVEADDLRRPRLKYLIEAVLWRSRLQ